MSAKPIFSVVILLTISLSSFAQISDYIESSKFEWTYWEAISDDAEKSGFFQKAGLNSISADKAKVVDINGDQLPDAVYIPGDNKVVLMLNDGSSFHTILDLDESLLMIGRPKPWHPIYLLTKNENCCEAGYYSLNYYRPGYNESGDLVYNFDKSVVVQKDVELISENLPPFKFELKADLSLQTKADPQSGEIGKYTTSMSGYAVASKTGTDGRTWWLVLMPLEDNSLKAGWMPSNDLKRRFR